ncbi:hypothetical protein F4861DRAFT_89216 [Xylaria intraflava]|nr:hypothetical protein F4861DRAFT_89216 [Xylaria intraflava]
MHYSGVVYNINRISHEALGPDGIMIDFILCISSLILGLVICFANFFLLAILFSLSDSMLLRKNETISVGKKYPGVVYLACTILRGLRLVCATLLYLQVSIIVANPPIPRITWPLGRRAARDVVNSSGNIVRFQTRLQGAEKPTIIRVIHPVLNPNGFTMQFAFFAKDHNAHTAWYLPQMRCLPSGRI